jgi:hypothetical protein
MISYADFLFSLKPEALPSLPVSIKRDPDPPKDKKALQVETFFAMVDL